MKGIAVGGKHDGKEVVMADSTYYDFVNRPVEDRYVFSGEIDDEGRAIFIPEELAR